MCIRDRCNVEFLVEQMAFFFSIAPMPEAIFCVILSIWLCHTKFPSMSIPRDLLVDTCNWAIFFSLKLLNLLAAIFGLTKITQFRLQFFSVNGSIICSGLHFWRHWFNMTELLSKFGEQQLVMVNYASGFSQSETGKYLILKESYPVTILTD